jgi:hypothetical protein
MCRWEGNIKVDVTEAGYDDADCKPIQLTQTRSDSI